MIRFSTKTVLALPRFFGYRNDVDIFTEDKVADKEFYRSLFKKVFQERIKINDITPLGCKANVLTAYDNQPTKVKRKQFYIVDGDLDLINGTNRKNENNLIILDSYCIENYIINEDGAIELIYLSCGTQTKEDIKLKLNFEKWLNYNSKCLIELFLHFAILKKYGGGLKVRNANEFLKQHQKQTIIDQSSIEKYSAEVKVDIIQRLKDSGFSEPNIIYEREIELYKKNWNQNTESLLKIVSAKNYLLPILQHRINHCIGKGKMLIKTESIKLFLANHSNLSRLKYLTERIK